MFGLSLVLAAATAAAPAASPQPAPLQQPIYGPEAAWVRLLPIPRDVKPSGAAVDTLLFTGQSRLAPGDEETFAEAAVRIDAPEGLQEAGNLMQVWDPATQTLTIHRARILRGDKIIDLLADGRRFTVLRRETNLEAAVIDGQLTATLQPEGLQVGDILDLAFTLARHDPALAGHAEGIAVTGHKGAVGRQYVSIAWPADRPVRTWKTDDMPVLTPATHDGWTQVVVDRADAVSPEPPKGAPPSALLLGMAMASDFTDWKAVSATAYPLYAKAATLAPGSPLLAEIGRIRAASSDPKAQALAAFELVESKTRYLAVLMNAGGLTPAPADLTWSRRFGDCKGKTVLLLALLHGLGIEAEPALVSTSVGEALATSLPELESFDHVIVRAEIAGRVYWLDPTRVGDENLDVIPVPNYRWALPVRAGGAELERLEPKPPTLPLVETKETVDLTAGVAKPAKVHEDMILRGDGGWAFGVGMQRASPVDRDRALKGMFARSEPWVTPDKVGFAYDPQTMEARATLDGTGSPPFTTENQAAGDDRDWMIGSSSIGYDPDFARTGDYHRDAPYAVGYPGYARATVDVRLPDGGNGFEAVNGDSVARTVAGVEYSRAAAVVGDHFSMAASARAVTQAVPASEAMADADALRSLADYQVSLRSSTPKAEDGIFKAVTARPYMKLHDELGALYKVNALGKSNFGMALQDGVKLNPAARHGALGLVETAPAVMGAVPDNEQMQREYPQVALAMSLDGAATMTCAVELDDRLDECRVDDERPAGLGFGAAALRLAAYFSATPPILKGAPVKGPITIPIRFQLGDRPKPPPPAPIPPPTSPAALSLARDVVAVDDDAGRLKGLATAYTSQLTVQIVSGGDAAAGELIADAYRQGLDDAVAEEVDKRARLMAAGMTADQLRATLDYLKTPAGAAFRSSQARIADLKLTDFWSRVSALAKMHLCDRGGCPSQTADAASK